MRWRDRVIHETHYLNTDLDLVAERDLTLLVSALTDRGVPSLSMFQRDDGRWQATFETEEVFRNADANISALLTAIEGLSPEPLSAWSACSVREFNIGYDCGDEPWAFTDQITTGTLTRITALGASLRITLYPIRNSSRDGESSAPSGVTVDIQPS
jgi:hypothetical protein